MLRYTTALRWMLVGTIARTVSTVAVTFDHTEARSEAVRITGRVALAVLGCSKTAYLDSARNPTLPLHQATGTKAWARRGLQNMVNSTGGQLPPLLRTMVDASSPIDGAFGFRPQPPWAIEVGG